MSDFALYTGYNERTKPRAGDMNDVARALRNARGVGRARVYRGDDGGLVVDVPDILAPPPRVSFWPRLVLHAGDYQADPPKPDKWFLHVRRGWRWAVRDLPLELKPDDDPVTGAPIDEWCWEITDNTHDGKAAFLTFSYASSAWEQLPNPLPTQTTPMPKYDTPPGDPDAAGVRLFVFGRIKWPSGQSQPALDIEEPGNAVVFIPSNITPTRVGVSYPGTSKELSRADHSHGYDPEQFVGTASPLFYFGSITDPVAVLGLDAYGSIGWVATSRCVEEV